MPCPDTAVSSAEIPPITFVGVPKELREAIKKTEIVKSLRTADFREAKRLVAFESADTDALFISEREKLNPVAKT